MMHDVEIDPRLDLGANRDWHIGEMGHVYWCGWEVIDQGVSEDELKCR